ncbi:hypothetical protein M758_7G050800 [Ceratodon purpureus]|nr:hypothetical protein M758_7G050800 [Ceratodon purpureus]
MVNILVGDVQMSHEGMITVTFGEKEIKFKKGTKAGKVLKYMAQMFPQGVLVHAGEENLIVTSQEENLSQIEYIYQHSDVAISDTTGLDNKILQVVLRLQVVKKGELVTYGTAVIFNKKGMCLTVNHYLEAARMRTKDKRLRVDGHQVEILARDANLDIACLQITDGDGIDFDFVSLGYMLFPHMKIHLISYPFMLKEEFMMSTPTVTHGQVASVLNPF